ncbi:MAG: hypothetical protein ACXVW7_17235 [Trebonia sp.]
MADLPTGELIDVLGAALAAASAELFGGSPARVTLSVVADTLLLAEAAPGAGGVRRESQSERLDLDPQHPNGPYRTAFVPAPGARLVRALVGDAVAFSFRDDEVAWSPSEPQSFTLTPRPNRLLAGVTGLRVMYAVNAVSATTAGLGKVTLALAGASSDVYRARDLALAVLALEADVLLAHVETTRREGDYTTTQRATGLTVVSVELMESAADALSCRLVVDLQREVKAERALRDGEGTPISRILSPGATGTGPVIVAPVLTD